MQPPNNYQLPSSIIHHYNNNNRSILNHGNAVIVNHSHAAFSDINWGTETVEKCVRAITAVQCCRETHSRLTISSPDSEAILSKDDITIKLLKNRFDQLVEEEVRKSQQEAGRFEVIQEYYTVPQRRETASYQLFQPQAVLPQMHGSVHPASIAPYPWPITIDQEQNQGLSYSQRTSPSNAQIKHVFGCHKVTFQMTESGDLEIKHSHGKYEIIPTEKRKRQSIQDLKERVSNCVHAMQSCKIPRGCPFSESQISKSIEVEHADINSRLDKRDVVRKRRNPSKEVTKNSSQASISERIETQPERTQQIFEQTPQLLPIPSREIAIYYERVKAGISSLESANGLEIEERQRVLYRDMESLKIAMHSMPLTAEIEQTLLQGDFAMQASRERLDRTQIQSQKDYQQSMSCSQPRLFPSTREEMPSSSSAKPRHPSRKRARREARVENDSSAETNRRQWSAEIRNEIAQAGAKSDVEVSEEEVNLFLEGAARVPKPRKKSGLSVEDLLN